MGLFAFNPSLRGKIMRPEYVQIGSGAQPKRVDCLSNRESALDLCVSQWPLFESHDWARQQCPHDTAYQLEISATFSTCVDQNQPREGHLDGSYNLEAPLDCEWTFVALQTIQQWEAFISARKDAWPIFLKWTMYDLCPRWCCAGAFLGGE